jgi:hypothetical protein
MTSQSPRFHLSLHVRAARLAAMTDFYATLFGEPPRKRHADYVQFDLAEPALNLTFTPRAGDATGEIDHLGLQVFSGAALDAARARLVAAGLSPRDERAVECCYSRQDKFWLTDPEGREVEVFHRLADVERPAASAAPGACCTGNGCEPA